MGKVILNQLVLLNKNDILTRGVGDGRCGLWEAVSILGDPSGYNSWQSTPGMGERPEPFDGRNLKGGYFSPLKNIIFWYKDCWRPYIYTGGSLGLQQLAVNSWPWRDSNHFFQQISILGSRGILGNTTVGSQLSAWERLEAFDGRSFSPSKVSFFWGRIVSTGGIFWFYNSWQSTLRRETLT